MPQNKNALTQEEQDIVDIAEAASTRSEKFAGRGGAAFTLGAADSLTFGLSNVALTKSGVVSPETIIGIEEENAFAHGAGQVAGVVVPAIGEVVAAIPTGGTSLAGTALRTGAKAAAKAGTGMRMADKVGRATAKYLSRTLPVSNKLAKSVLSSAAGAAVEGSAYTAGRLASEHALGRLDLNAESLLSQVGTNAIIDAGIGGSIPILGKALAKMRKPAQKAMDKVADMAFDKKKAAIDLLDATPAQAEKLVKRGIIDDLPEFFAKADFNHLDNAEDRLAKVVGLKEGVGQRIGEIRVDADNLVRELGDKRIIDMESIANSVRDEVLEEYKGLRQYNAVKKQMDDAVGDLLEATSGKDVQDKIGLFSGVNEYRQKIDQHLSKVYDRLKPMHEQAPNIQFDITLRGKIDEGVKDWLQSAGERIGDTTLIDTLKDLNKDYRMASVLEPLMLRAAQKGTKAKAFNFTNLMAMGTSPIAWAVGGPVAGAIAAIPAATRALRSDVANIAKIKHLGAMNGAREIAETSIKNAAKMLVAPSRRLAVSYTRTPISDYDKVTEKVSESASPETLSRTIDAQLGGIGESAPETMALIAERMAGASQFLNSKMPVPPEAFQGKPYANKWQPSKQDKSTFLRYYDAVGNPLKSVEHMASTGAPNYEAIEAIQKVYPTLYGELLQQITEELGETRELDYASRLLLGVMFNAPFDAASDPNMTLQLQLNWTAENQQAQQQVKSVARQTTPKAANNLETETQRISKGL